MRIILIKNILGLGQSDDIKEVKMGYWRNFLMPQGLAVAATTALIKEAETRKEVVNQKRLKKEDKNSKALQKLLGKTLTISLNADEKGNLFAGFDIKKLIQLLNKEVGILLTKEAFDIKKPIKEIGLHKITVNNITFDLQIDGAEQTNVLR